MISMYYLCKYGTMAFAFLSILYFSRCQGASGKKEERTEVWLIQVGRYTTKHSVLYSTHTCSTYCTPNTLLNHTLYYKQYHKCLLSSTVCFHLGNHKDSLQLGNLFLV